MGFCHHITSLWYYYSDYLLKMSSFYIKMSPSFDPPVFTVAFPVWILVSFGAQFFCLLQCWLLFSHTVCLSNVHLLHCTLFSLVSLVLCISVRLPWLFFSFPLGLKYLVSFIFCLSFVLGQECVLLQILTIILLFIICHLSSAVVKCPSALNLLDAILFHLSWFSNKFSCCFGAVFVLFSLFFFFSLSSR